jgi:HAD superfamily hydrolase (TIGR01456 family)
MRAQSALRMSRLGRPLKRYLQSCAGYFNKQAFVFDIDGVFLRGSRVLDAGVRAMSLLYDSSHQRWRAPVAFLTNSGGMSEASRAAILTSMLGVSVLPSQVVLAHTPLIRFARELSRPGHSVVTVGGPGCPDVARLYGFERVLDIAHLGQAWPESTPFARYDGLPELSAADVEHASLPVSAALVMTDSRDFHRDLQLLVDIVEKGRSGGNVGLATIAFCNPDVTFPAECKTPRLAGGILRIALDAALVALRANFDGTSRDEPMYRALQIGKPYSINFDVAEQALLRQIPGCDGETNVKNILDRIYMIGDNPHSDIAGANSRGRPWHSVLLRSGVYQGGSHEADVVHDDVHEAVLNTKSW